MFEQVQTLEVCCRIQNPPVNKRLRSFSIYPKGEIARMKKYYPNKTSLKILIVVFLALTIFLNIAARLYLSAYPIIMWSAIGLFWVLFIIIVLIGFPIYFSKTYYYVSSTEISKQSGIFIESRQLMRVNSIQYVTRVITPFSRYTGLNFLKMNALGGYLVLLFLSRADAEDIASTISASIRKNAD